MHSTKATLATSVAAHDQVCGCTIPIEVDLTWTAIGPVETYRADHRLAPPGGSFGLRLDSSESRQAAVVGTGSDGSTLTIYSSSTPPSSEASLLASD